MKHFRSLGLAVALMASAAVAIVATVSDCVLATWRAAKSLCADIATKILTGPDTAEPEKAASLRGFVQHRENHRTQIKRQSPRIEDSWRMCPST